MKAAMQTGFMLMIRGNQEIDTHIAVHASGPVEVTETDGNIEMTQTLGTNLISLVAQSHDGRGHMRTIVATMIGRELDESRPAVTKVSFFAPDLDAIGVRLSEFFRQRIIDTGRDIDVTEMNEAVEAVTRDVMAQVKAAIAYDETLERETQPAGATA